MKILFKILTYEKRYCSVGKIKCFEIYIFLSVYMVVIVKMPKNVVKLSFIKMVD